MNTKRVGQAVVMALLLVATVDAVSAGEGRARAENASRRARKAKKERSPIRGRYKAMVKHLEMSEAQVSQLKALLVSHQQADKQWKQQNRPRLKELKASRNAAAQAGDKARAKQIGKELKQLHQARKAMDDQLTRQIQGLLTEAQRDAWRDNRLASRITGRYRKAQLSDEQKTRIGELVRASSAELTAGDRKVRKQAFREVHSAIESNILSAEQRSRLQARSPKRSAKRPVEVETEADDQ